MFQLSKLVEKPLFTRLLKTIYPDRCLGCGEEIVGRASLCTTCWSDAHFLDGATCTKCSVPVLGDALDGEVICEACHADPPAWSAGRAVGLYEGPLRRMVLSLKHGDRQDLVPSMAQWMVRAGADILHPQAVIAPIPLHWRRLLGRRSNQSALLAACIARSTGSTHIPDLLHRHRSTPPQKGLSRDERFKNQRAAISVNARKDIWLAGQDVVLVDDVMTTGATLSAATEACLSGGAKSVGVLVFARVARPE